MNHNLDRVRLNVIEEFDSNNDKIRDVLSGGLTVKCFDDLHYYHEMNRSIIFDTLKCMVEQNAKLDKKIGKNTSLRELKEALSI